MSDADDISDPSVWLRPNRRRLVYLLLIVYIAGAHLRLSQYSASGSVVVPMYPMLLSATALALMFWSELFRRLGRLLLLLIGFMVLQPVLALAPGSGDLDALRSGAQLTGSVVSALVVIYATSRLDARGLRRFFFGFWAFLLALAFLESVGLRPVFDDIRSALYSGSGRGVYLESGRDVVLYGKVRPSALASEPSFLADSYMCMAALVFLLDDRRGRPYSWARLLLMVGIGFAVAPSFKVVFYLLALVCWQLWPRSTRAYSGVGVTFVAVGFALYASAGGMVGRLIDRLAVAETGSFFGRISVGPQVALEALWRHPFLGYGIGNTDGPSPILVRVWQESGAFARFPWFHGAGPTSLMSSGFWWQWVFLGILGGLVFTLLTTKLLAALGVPRPLRSVTCAWIVWYGGAAFIDPVSWFIVAVFSIPAVFAVAPGRPEVSRRASSESVRTLDRSTKLAGRGSPSMDTERPD